MYNEYAVPILAVMAAVMLILWILNKRELGRMRSENLKLLKENDVLSKNKRLGFKETVQKQKKENVKTEDEKSDSAESSSKKKVKKENEKDSPVVSELKEKIRVLKSDNAVLKEKNYNLSRDNDSLRSDVRSNASSTEQDQHELIDLREKNASLTSQLREVSAKLKDLEKVQETQAKPVEKIEAQDAAPVVSDDSEELTQLQKENASLSSSLRDVRGELASFKRDFKAQLEHAKAETAESNKSIRKELLAAQKSAAQSKKRADNNHQIYLIARSQLMLAEKRILSLDPSYRPQYPLPVNNDAIDETIKKFVSFNARESRASVDVIHKDKTIDELKERIRELEDEVSSNKTCPDLSFGDLAQDDSLSEIVSSFAKNMPENSGMIPLETPSISGIETGSFADLDFSKLDDDDWGL